MAITKSTFILLLLFFKIMYCTGTDAWLQSMKKLKEKVKKVKDDVKVVTESKQGPSLKFVAKSDILYPGQDQEKTKKVNQMWADYYECQRALYETSVRLVVPEAMGFQQGTTALLECEVCESPRDLFVDTKWFYSEDYNMNSVVELSLSHTVSIKDNDLYLYNIQEPQGGLYVCKKGNHIARPFIVHVFTNESTRMVVPIYNSEGEHPVADTLIPELGLTLTTRWGEWTQCNRCNQVGKRYRHGVCTILLNAGSRRKRETHMPPFLSKTILELFNASVAQKSMFEMVHEYLSANSTETVESTTQETTTEVITTTEQIQINMTLKDDLEMLSYFEDGIPCRSKLISEHIRNLEAVASRKSEVMVAYCKLSCPKSVTFVVVDEKGKVVETANNTAGYYSVLQGLPRELPTVTRTVEFATYKKYFRIECPDVVDGDIPVVWFIKKKALTNKLLQKETNGRIKIDEYNRIVFNPALKEDSRVFSCWQHNVLVGTVRLKVEKIHDLKYQRTIMGIGVVVLLLLFSWVYYQVFIHS